MKIGSIGVTLDGIPGLWEIDTIWGDGELTIVLISDDTIQRHIEPGNFWVLL